MPFDLSPEELSEDSIRDAAAQDYMNRAQLEFFRLRLAGMRDELLQRQAQRRAQITSAESESDMNDRATRAEEEFVATALREREQRELDAIDAALRRIATGEYGWCERTGEEIGIARLLAQPTARTVVRKAA
jgi:DnaK suppressor protein